MTPPQASESSSGEAGFSILESLIALTILLTVLVSVSSLMTTAFKVGANSRYEQAATEIAASTLDAQIQTGVTTLLGETGDTALPSVKSGGQTYLLEMEVGPYTAGNTACQSPASNAETELQVTVWATWADEPSTATWWIAGTSTATGLIVHESSLVAVPSAAINTTEGSILVTIEGADGLGDPNITVTATPSTGSAITTTTTASGCALFANLSVSPTWTVSFSCPSGYITAQNTATCLGTMSNLSVPADSTLSLAYIPTTNTQYDQAATVTATYSAPKVAGAAPVIPNNANTIPLSFYNTDMTSNPYVTTASATVFPYLTSPSYNVVAGSCGAESAPDGGSTDGTAVNLTSGGNSTVPISLVPIQILVSQGGSLVTGAAVTASVATTAGATDTNCPTTGTLAMPTLNVGTTCAGGGCATPAAFRRGGHRDAILVLTNCNHCATAATVGSTTSATYGSPVTLTATVTCSGTNCGTVNAGTVTFVDSTTSAALGSGTVDSSGVATITTSPTLPVGSLKVGSNSITATYNGSGKWNASAASAGQTQTITAAPTTTTLASTPNPGTYQATATLTATVTAATPSTAIPTGTVKFTSGGTPISACSAVTLSSGAAACTFPGSAVGNYSLAAVYTPSPANFVTSTSSTLIENILAASTTTVLTSNSNPSVSGSSVTITATVTAVSGGPPAGTVVFKDGTTTLGSVAVNASGVATYASSTLATGTHSLTAVFTPTSTTNFTGSTGSLTQSVGTSYVLGCLPYGVWKLSASTSTATSATEASQVVVVISASGITVYGATNIANGTTLAAGGAVTVQIQ
ncbi:MAG TPA: Ig-like domain-containing protein [Acidimicrobiales bacterium]